MKNIIAIIFLVAILLTACSNSPDVTSVTNSEIYLVSADGSNIKMLTKNEIEEIRPCWSPDGTKIAFAATPDWINFDIYVMNADGSNMVLLDSGVNPQWSPDGTKIAYESGGVGNGNICVINADGSGKVQLTNDDESKSGLTWVPGSNMVSYSSYNKEDNSQDIYTVNDNGTGLVNLTNSIPREQEYVWSPDGNKIAYIAWLQGEDNNDIYIMNADGTEKIYITSHTSMSSYFTWSPDSSRLAFFSGPGIYGDIYVVNADGSGLTKLTDIFGWIEGIEWSPADDEIAFSCIINPNPQQEPTEVRKIYVMNADGSDLATLTSEGDEGYSSPLWSSDGGKIACISSSWENKKIYIMNNDGSDVFRILSNKQCGSYLQWSPDGSKILLTAAP